MKSNRIIFGICVLLLGIAGCDYYTKKDIKYEATPNVQSLNMFVGDDFQLSANPTELKFTWTSDNTNVATVSSSGLVTAVGRGMTEITARAGDVFCKVPLNSIVRIPLVDYLLGTTALDMIIGGSQEVKLIPEPTDANDMGTIEWSSINPNVATVNYAGIIKAVGIGTTQVECNVNGIVRTINVRVSRTFPAKQHIVSKAQPCVIIMADFDLGGNGVAYGWTGGPDGDLAPGYRASLGDPNCPVGIESGSSMYGSNVGWTGSGKWLQYTFDVVDDSDYIFDLYVGLDSSTAQYSFELDETIDSGVVSMSGWSGGWQGYRWYHQQQSPATAPVANLTAGRHTLRFMFETGGFNISAIRLTAAN